MHWSSPRPSEDARWTRSSTLALCALVIVAVVSLPWLWSPHLHPALLDIDAALYLIGAEHMLEGEGYSYLGEPFVIRPPGFSAMIAPAIALFGSGWEALTLYINAVGVLGVALFFLYQRTRLGEPLALAVALAVWFNPGYQRLCNQILSDIPGVAAIFFILLLERWSRRRPSLRRDLAVAVCIGVAGYLRTVSLVLVPAIVFARTIRAIERGPEEATWTRFVRRRLAVIVAVPFLVLLPWSVRNAAVRPTTPAEHTLFSSYSTAMLHQDMGDPESPWITPGQFGERVRRRVQDVTCVLGSRMQNRFCSPHHRGLAYLGLACFALVLFARRGTGDWLTAGLILVLCTYFGFLSRLVLPIWMMVFAATAQAAAWAGRKWAGPKAGVAAALLLVAGTAAADFRPHWQWEMMERRSEEWTRLRTFIDERVPRDVPLAAEFGPVLQVVLDRPVYSLRYVMTRDGIPGTLSLLDRHEVRAVLLRPDDETHRPVLDAIRSRSAHATSERFGALELIRRDRSP